MTLTTAGASSWPHTSRSCVVPLATVMVLRVTELQIVLWNVIQFEKARNLPNQGEGLAHATV